MSRIYSPEIFRKGDKILRVANTEKGWMFAGKDLIDVMGIETRNVAATIRKAVSVKNIAMKLPLLFFQTPRCFLSFR